MTQAFDERIVRVGIEFADGIKYYEGLAIYASGVQYGSAQMNECQIRIFNLTAENRNYILSRCSPMRFRPGIERPINVTLDVGRKSYGVFRIFSGKVIACDVTQPPDIGIVLQSLSNSYLMGVILGINESSIAPLSAICKSIAKNSGLILDFQAKDKQIENWIFNGAAANQIKLLNDMGEVKAWENNGTLHVLDQDKALKGEPILISAETGMVGIPQITQYGCLVRVMIDSSIKLGGTVKIVSKTAPTVNGLYMVYKINFEVANRDQAFWYSLECTNDPRWYDASAA